MESKSKGKISKDKLNDIAINQDIAESIETIKESKNCIYFGLCLFVATALLGYFYPIFFVEEILEAIKQLFLSFEGLNTFQIIIKIFFNNSRIALLSICLGLIIGLFPLWALIQNGYVIGFIINKVVEVEGLSVLWRLIPHGIFELPAIFISMGLGLRIGWKVIRRDNAWEFLKDSLKTFIFIIIPLLFVAAIIEGLLIGMGI
jgi:stage II sporulation protein M